MKKIAITGASGFIGSFLVEEGLKQGYDIYANVRSSSNKKYLDDSRINFINLSLGKQKKMVEELKDLKKQGISFDYFIHNAGATNVLNKEDFFKVNYQYTRNLVEALIESECIPKKFIYMGSLAAYGPGNAKTGFPIKESDIPKPITLYGKSKLASEYYIRSLDNFPYLIFRPTGVYGPREKEYLSFFKTINRSIEPYIGSPNQLLSFIYVKDLVKMIYLAINSDVVNKAYFVTDGKNYTSGEFAEIVKQNLSKKTIRIVFPKGLVKVIAFVSENIARITKKPSLLNSEKYKELTALNWLCDSAEIEQDLNFTPEYDLKKGVEETIVWYKENKLL